MRGETAGRLSRRELIGGALAVGATASLAGCGGHASMPVDDGKLLSEALRSEQLSVIAYEHVLSLPDVDSQAAAVLSVLLDHERIHVRVLEQQLGALGRALPPGPSKTDQVDGALAAHGMSARANKIADRKGALQYLLDVEALCEGAYYTAIGKLTRADAVSRSTQALVDEAQHSALIGDLLYPGQFALSVPYWYVTGIG